MLTTIILVAFYLGLHTGLYKIFQQNGIDGWKAFVPFYSDALWCKLIGRSPYFCLWLLVPIVGFFAGAGMLIDLVRSYKKDSFGAAFAAVAFPFIYIPYVAFSKDASFYGPAWKMQYEWRQKMQEATKKGDKYELARLEKEVPFPAKGIIREWTEAIIFALFAAHFIRLFFIEAFTIPTPSMEGSLLVGDFLFVSKVHYGIRLPMTPLSFPLLHNVMPFTGGESYSTAVQWGYYRLPALQNVERYDPVVFNYPEDDTSFANTDFSQQYHNVANNGSKTREQLLKLKPIRVRPVDKRDNYIKRCVGIPGDKIEVREGVLFVNDQKAPELKGIQYAYTIYSNVRLDIQQLEDKYPVTFEAGDPSHSTAYMNPAVAEKMKAEIPGIDSIRRALYPPTETRNPMFPYNRAIYPWNIDYYGPITVPKKGTPIALNANNIHLYIRLIQAYEGNKLEIKDGQFFINGTPTNEYTPKMDYYWMMGDNRNNSADSRMWGFVPEDHIVGKPLFVWMSFKNGSMRDGVRWNRIFMGASGQ